MRVHFRSLCAAVMIVWLGAASAEANPVTGRVAVKGRGDRGAAPTRPAAPATIEQKGKTFVPRVVAVPVGTEVRFPNHDSIFHNVFSLSQGNAFDLGLYRAGASKSRVFTEPATYRVFCNIHPQMTAVLVATPSPWLAVAARDGTFRIELPAGRYRVTALSERAAAVTAEVSVAGTTTAPPMALDESAFAAVTHLNKFGRPYPPEAYRQ